MEIKTISTGSGGNCYLLTNSKGRSLLVECGIPIRKIKEALNFKLAGVDACLISHEHGDHSKAAKSLLDECIPIVCSKGTAAALGIENHYRYVPIIVGDKNAHNAFLMGFGWKISAYRAVHDAAEPVMFTIADDEDTLLFATDTMYMPHLFHGLTKIMIECNYGLDILNGRIKDEEVASVRKRRLINTHMEIQTLEDFFSSMHSEGHLDSVKEIRLVHLSGKNSNEEEFIKRIERVTGIPVYAE